PLSPARTIRDYLLLVLFTGLRRNEAATLKWSAVDFDARTLTIEDTKNGIVHALPQTGLLYALLRGRVAKTTSQYVFPGAGASGHLVTPDKQIQKIRTQ